MNIKQKETKTAALILNGPITGGDKGLSVILKNHMPAPSDYILCADGGYNLANKAGIRCDAVIGDMDSASGISPDIKQILFDRDKDKTDGQLAAEHLLNAGYKRINIYGALGGRPDHVAANINLLALIHERGGEPVIYDKDIEIYFVSDYLEFECMKDDIISVLPYTDKITFKESEGLLYPLKDLTIERFSSRGISNKAAGDKVSIVVKEGKAFVYRIQVL